MPQHSQDGGLSGQIGFGDQIAGEAFGPHRFELAKQLAQRLGTRQRGSPSHGRKSLDGLGIEARVQEGRIRKGKHHRSGDYSSSRGRPGRTGPRPK